MIFSWTDSLDIILIAVLIYYVLSILKGTRSMQMLIGILFLVGIYYASQILHLRSLHWLLKNLFGYFVLTIIILFQQEIRMALANIGIPFFKRRTKFPADFVEDIILAAESLSSKKIGAILVFEREIGLKNYITTGVPIDAVISYDLLLSIFMPKSPLHDGAVIIQGNKIAAAACYLPLTTEAHLAKELGTRHRAAIGITEETDAIAIVISEETGIISFVCSGAIKRNLELKALQSLLIEFLFGKKKRDMKVQDAQNQATVSQ
ncbi:MAG: TIGR00159 family protein [Candidatus Fischerbacteria bacterium RBG_13_37_8]|uniref:Diadenylate cyclase n=1 Tax=Candidatus Fischerbacteria bacterium RBG_13_37_8 TaxID=1817863 RepID=A0A1F5V5N8_9BACT|nr:MAG: TIGR00159 family protein [Candidatus Fischerbacteria bacterium RBG_13_37_8]